MKKIALATIAALGLTGSALAADMPVKAPKIVAPVVTNPWDVAFGAGIYSNYIFRGISQSNNGPSVNAYFEPRYNVNPNLQLYAGVAGWSIDFSNRATAEIDIYGGIRPTFGPVAFDFGIWYYYYPKGECYNSTFSPGLCYPSLPVNGNVIKDDLSFLEYYAKATWTVNDNVAIGGQFYYDDNWLNFGFDAQYAAATLKLTAPSNWLPTGFGLYASGEFGRYWLGTTDAFYGNLRLPDYNTWNVGVGLTWNVFTVDLRYYDTDLSQGECNAITSDFGASYSPSNIIPVLNPGGYGSKWCGQAYVISLKADLTYGSNLK
ncbi:TorF family putative porin [Rhodoplanes sp. SY1]|uniref:TorF family putative porin n=1 Tax=Rhodoplanes sp. SY1 TaxID=3166646 RepID=UPI0038B5A0B5